MFDNIRMRVSFSDLQERITEKELYKAFAKEFGKKTISSPFRKDKHPSFCYYNKRGKWLWYDQATGEGGDIYEYIKRAEGLRDFREVIELINTRLVLGLEKPHFDRPAQIIQHPSKTKKLASPDSTVFMQIIRKSYSAAEYALWYRWCITPDILKFYQVYAASQVWVRDEQEEMQLVWTRKDDNPIYVFHFPHSKHVKCYRPDEPDRRFKFIGNANNETDVQGYAQCDIKVRRPHLLIITKALKEVMFLRSFGFDAIAPHGEGHHLDPEFISHLRKYCGRIITFYDNDPMGRHGAWMMRSQFDIPVFIVPKQWKAKNITDLWQTNREQAYRIIRYLSKWSTYQAHFKSYRNLLQGQVQSVPNFASPRISEKD